MNYTHEIEKMCTVAKGCDHGPAPIPEEGRWVKAYEIKDISGFFNEFIYIKSQSKKAFSATTPFANANLKAVSIV